MEKNMSNFNIDLEKQLSKLGKDIQQFVERTVPGQRDLTDFEAVSDIVESRDHFIIYIDLPGLTKKQVKITLKNRVITVSGERELFLEDDEELIRSERRQGAFSRAFAIPEQADEKSISASFADGVLKITLSKTGLDDESDATSIPIK
jgi:HSP20 family protein